MSRFVQTLATISLCVASFSTQLLRAQQVEKLEGLAFDYDHTGWISGFRYAAPGGEFADWLNGRSLKLATIAQITLEQHEILRSELEAIAKLGTLEVLVIGSYPDIVKLDDDAVEALGKINSLQELSIWAESTTTAKWQAIGDLQSLRVLEIGIGIVIGRFKTSHSWALQNQQRCECSVSGLTLVFRARGIAASQCFDGFSSVL